jgi:hypothetical protein
MAHDSKVFAYEPGPLELCDLSLITSISQFGMFTQVIHGQAPDRRGVCTLYTEMSYREMGQHIAKEIT